MTSSVPSSRFKKHPGGFLKAHFALVLARPKWCEPSVSVSTAEDSAD